MPKLLQQRAHRIDQFAFNVVKNQSALEECQNFENWNEKKSFHLCKGDGLCVWNCISISLSISKPLQILKKETLPWQRPSLWLCDVTTCSIMRIQFAIIKLSALCGGGPIFNTILFLVCYYFFLLFHFYLVSFLLISRISSTNL